MVEHGQEDHDEDEDELPRDRKKKKGEKQKESSSGSREPRVEFSDAQRAAYERHAKTIEVREIQEQALEEARKQAELAAKASASSEDRLAQAMGQAEEAKKVFEAGQRKAFKEEEHEERFEKYEHAEHLYRHALEHAFDPEDPEQKAAFEKLARKLIFKEHHEPPLPSDELKAFFAKRYRALRQLPKKWEAEIDVELLHVDHEYAAMERWAQALPPGWRKKIYTSRIAEGARAVGRQLDRAAEIMRPTFFRPLVFSGVVAGSILGGLAKLFGSLFEKQIKSGKELVNEFTFGQAFTGEGSSGGKKGGGGHGGGGHH